jgi:hypothetical protein
MSEEGLLGAVGMEEKWRAALFQGEFKLFF